MGDRSTSMTGSAGEHYVAYKLALMGYLPALTRGGSPSVDILVASKNGSRTVAIQVKTKTSAKRERKRKKENEYWSWIVGDKALEQNSESFFYAFVDLKTESRESMPDVFIVPSEKVFKLVQSLKNESIINFWIENHEASEYLNCWDPIVNALKDG